MYQYTLFSDYGYNLLEVFSWKETPLSSAYHHPLLDTVIIVDYPSIFTTEFPYKRYCQKQNELMKQYKNVYRFLDSHPDLHAFLGSSLFESETYDTGMTMDRESYSIDPSPLEHIFETCFGEAYGQEAFSYVKREFSILTYEGKTAYIDFAMFKKDNSWIAVEENGISYHHPFLIGEEAYLKILRKQNAVIAQGGTVFRWDTESLTNTDRTADEIKEFIGDISHYIPQDAIKAARRFKLYEHQAEYLSDLDNTRTSGNDSALVVLPTGTGKTVVALEDIKKYINKNPGTKILVLVPTLDLVRQWQQETQIHSKENENIEIKTYAAIARQYFSQSPDTYSYIIVDEAHHAVAPVLKKVIAHFKPGFLLGLTATDKRLDARKLEAVFSEYEEKIDLKEAIEKGLLSQIRAFRLETNIDLSSVRFNGKDYINADLERSVRVASRNEMIAELLYENFYQKLSGKSGIIFCVNVEHAKEMAGLLRGKGFKAESIDGKDKDRFRKTEAYMKKEIQFLCTCSLLTEGWDAPHTSVIVMARPTMSKVLYTQQLGRGTRNYPGKEALYVIDVVDNYGSFGQISNRPWSVHGLFNFLDYMPWGNLTKAKTSDYEMQILDTTAETLIKLQPYDIFTMQKTYEDFLSAEQLARELFVSTGTVISWVRKGEVQPDLTIPMGRNRLLFFHPDRANEIRLAKGLKEHTEESITEDFWAFIAEGNYTFSYKMYFILALLDMADSTGDADVKKLMNQYRSYYLDRFEKKLVIDRPNSPYNSRDYIMDDRVMTRSMLENPFEKFERKRFMYYAKDLSKISIHHKIWDDLTSNNGAEKLRSQMKEDLHNYYQQLEG